MAMASPQVHRPRTIKKLEKPKTLKINQRIEFETSSRSPQVDDIVSSLDKVTMILNNGFYDQNIQSNIITMSNHLKLFSDDLEKYYKDQLDRAFVAIRNGSQDDRLDLNSRIHLLELIELRAKQWRLTEHTNAYYAQKKSDLSDNEENIQNPSINLMASPSLETSNATTPVLGHNDILKSSGRFSKPTRIPGKNYKDEVVIRNSDSGKVMGIKGRRVHMIEELSETIISFQRVNPGQKERLVQITGNSEEKISYAKNLIKDTIQRNASPMRMEHLGRETGIGGSSSSLSSSTSEESARLQQVQNTTMNSGLLPNLTNDLNEYKYTVTVGNDSLKITGTNIELVQKAKLVLDDYFTEEPVEYFNYEEDNEFVSSNSTNYTPVSAGQTINSSKKANIPYENENGKSPISPEKDSKKNEPLRELSYDFLMQCSKGPYAKRPPADWENIQKEFPNIIQKAPIRWFEPESYKSKVAAGGFVTVMSTNEVENELE